MDLDKSKNTLENSHPERFSLLTKMCIGVATAGFVLVMMSFACGQLTTPECQPKWTSFEKSCYKIIDTPMSWYDANVRCNRRNGHLVWVESEEEQEFLANWAKNEIRESTWIGLTDIFVEGQWKWLNRPGKTTFEKWSSGEPNDFQTSEHCAALWSRANYTWFDTNCERKLPSICEKNPQ